MKQMRKYILLLILMLPVFAACVKEQDLVERYGSPDDLPYPEGAKTEIEISAFFPGEVGTKAMAETPQITSMRVVVFGSSGFLKESVDVDVDDGYFQAATTNGNGTLYRFKVQLTLTDSKKLRIHVIANCDNTFPWKGEDEVMRKFAYTEGNQDAYWYRFILTQGLELKKVYNAETDSFEYVKNGNIFEVTDEVTAAFSNLPLLRNFAKVSVESTTPQLVLNPTTKMAIINKPRRGSVAPSLSSGGFVADYHNQTYDNIRAAYDGFSPFDTDLTNTDPDAVDFVSDGDFMYERPRVTTTPSYLIVHGTYYPLQDNKTLNDWKNASDPANRYPNNPSAWLKSEGTDGYYKIDFMDDDGYYAILRNFRYHIRITGVSKAGAATPGAAGSTGGTGDISSSTEAQGLVDISDGYGRIAVSYVEMTIVDQHAEIELKYKFIPNADDGDAGVNNDLVSEDGPVTITIGDKTGPINVLSDTIDSSIASGIDFGTTGTGGTGKLRVLPGNDTEGFRTIKFSTNAPSSADKTTQIIRITGQIDEHRSIFREVKYILMEKQTMQVSCTADVPNPDWDANYVDKTAGEGVNVNIKVPILLPESMFPLVFNIESDALSITPNTAKYTNENLPVESGESICTGKEGKKTFHYVKTVSYDEYEALADNNGKTIVCHFKTNKAASASTVYVTNEYFNKGNARFENYQLFKFKNLAFTNYRAAANTNLNFSFSLDDEDSTRPRTVQVTLDGLLPQNANASGWGTTSAADGIFTYTISSGNTATLALKTTTNAGGYNGEYTVTLEVLDGETSKAIYRQAELYNLGYLEATLTIDNTNYQQNNISSNEVTFAFDNVTGGGNNNNRYKQFGSREYNWGWRYYSGNVTISAPSGYSITQIDITYTENNYSRQTVTYNPTDSSSDKNTWHGHSSSVEVTMNASNSNSNYNRVKSIKVTCVLD